VHGLATGHDTARTLLHWFREDYALAVIRIVVGLERLHELIVAAAILLLLEVVPHLLLDSFLMPLELAFQLQPTCYHISKKNKEY
jgi:hypothetical protein